MLRKDHRRRVVALACVLFMLVTLLGNGSIAAFAETTSPTDGEATAEGPATTSDNANTPNTGAPSNSDGASSTSEKDAPEAAPEAEDAPVATPQKTADEASAQATDSEDPTPSKAESDAPARAPADTRATSTDLADFLTDVVIDAPTNPDGSYNINPNVTYALTLKFGEGPNAQFEDNSTMSYTFPNGIIVSDVASTPFSIEVKDGQGTATVEGNTFWVQDGVLYVQFNQNDPNFNRLTATSNAEFDVTIASQYDQNVTSIEFAAIVIKEFTYEDKSDLTINKSVAYDMNSDTASYTLQVTSSGRNDNVVIEDYITGTALTFNKDVTAESNKGTVSAAPDYSAVENGFRITIPSMQDGEIITLHYTASVDNNKITGRGTVDQTNNTATVKSDQVPDGKQASADFNGQVTFRKVAKDLVGSLVDKGDGKYEATWTIRVNTDHKMVAGGKTIRDFVGGASTSYMWFTGSGISVKVTYENGSTETREIPWSELATQTNAHGIWEWKYVPPVTDGKASYEITSTTTIDASTALGDLRVRNYAEFEGTEDNATADVTGIGTGSMNMVKTAIGTTDKESEWKLVITDVPGTGLDELYVVDDMPHITYEGTSYADSLIEDSVKIDGLYEGESFKIRASGSTPSRFIIDFYKGEGAYGILPSEDGSARTFTITYKTAVNQDWLDLAVADDYQTSSLRTHSNEADVRSGSYRTLTTSASVIPIKPDLKKELAERSEVTIDGVTYPVFKYTLGLFGPTADGVVIHDSFDTNYLALYEADGVQIKGGTSLIQGDSNGSVSAVNTTDGANITVSTFPKNSNGQYYQYYQISYSLIVKDETALRALNEDAASNGGVMLNNTATWGDLTSSAQVEYTYFPYVDKELITRPTADNGYVAEFKVIINKYAEDLDPTSDTLTIQDVLSSNLRYVAGSVSISPANDNIAVRYDASENTLIFENVPDQTTYEITYSARVLGSSGSNVSYSNTIKFGQYEKTIEETVTIQSSGGGTASNPSITVVKRDSANDATTLAGAVFQLYYLNDDGNPVAVQDNSGQNVTFTTDSSGSFLVQGNQQALGWTLWAGRTYRLVETTAPAGYELNSDPTDFILSNSPSSQMEYAITGDQLTIQNTRAKISIPVSKTWVGPVGGPVTVHLLANGNDTGEELTLSADNNWSGEFADQLKYDEAGEEITYSIKEDPVDNYDPEYSGSQESGLVVTNKNTETVDVPVVKQWIGPVAEQEIVVESSLVQPTALWEDTMPIILTVRLLADKTTPVSTLYLWSGNNYSDVFRGLPKYDPSDGHEIEYSVEEVNVPEGYEARVSVNPDGGFIITNTNVETIDIPVTKTWIGPQAGPVTVSLTRDGTVVDSAELSATNDWQHTFTGLLKYDGEDGHAYVYDVEESDVEGYVSGKSGTADTGFTITNTITGKMSVPVTKAWIGPAAQSVTVRLLANGDPVDSVELNANNNWQHTFTDVDKYKDGQEIEYTVEEVKIAGYDSQITGTAAEGYVITNTNTAVRDVSVEKKWNGTPLLSVTIHLYADGKEVDAVELSDANSWKHVFTGLARYSSTDGHEIVYTISEDTIDGYTTSIEGNADDGFVITNTQDPTPDTPSPSKPGKSAKRRGLVRTGDDNNLLLYALLALVLGGIAIVVARIVRKRKDKDA